MIHRYFFLDILRQYKDRLLIKVSYIIPEVAFFGCGIGQQVEDGFLLTNTLGADGTLMQQTGKYSTPIKMGTLSWSTQSTFLTCLMQLDSHTSQEMKLRTGYLRALCNLYLRAIEFGHFPFCFGATFQGSKRRKYSSYKIIYSQLYFL